MAIIQDIKTFEKGMNKDADPRFLQPGEYIHAQDLDSDILGDDSGSGAGSILNIEGANGIYEVGLFDFSSNKIIGIKKDERTDSIYEFIYDSEGLHRILKYNVNEDTHSVVVVSANLPFTSTTKILSVVIIDNMIIWTDGENEVMYYNQDVDYIGSIGILEYDSSSSYTSGDKVWYNNIIYSALTTVPIGSYNPSGLFTDTTYWEVGDNDELTIDYFYLAKLVPSKAPVATTITDTTHKSNNINKRFFQFKYRYIYKDNQKSVFSPISNLAYTDADYIDPVLVTSESIYNNAISISISDDNINNLIEKIEIAARSGMGEFRSITTISADDLINNGSISHTFYNDGVYEVINTNESDQIYDDIPRVAKALIYSNNRLVFGDCLSGMDKIDIDITCQVNLNDIPSSTTKSFNSSDMTCLDSASDLGDLFETEGYSFVAGDIIRIEGDSFGVMYISVKAGYTIFDIYNKILSITFQLGDGGGLVGINDPYHYIDIDGREEDYENTYLEFYIQKQSHVNTFKKGAWYLPYLQYFDGHGRTNGAQYSTSGLTYIPTVGECWNNLVGPVSVTIKINHEPPSWAKYYIIAMSRNTTSDYSEYFVVDASVSSVSAGESLPSGARRLNVKSYGVFQSNHGQASNLSYDFVKGDRIRFITKGSSASAGDEEWVESIYDYQILNAGTDYGANTTGSTNDNYLWLDVFIPIGAGGFSSATEIEDAVIEIYRPGREIEEDESIAYETTKMFPIVNGSHYGDINQVLNGNGNGSAFKILYDSGEANQIISARISDINGFPDSSGSPSLLIISSITLDESIYPQYTGGEGIGYKVQYNGRTYECLVAGATIAPTGENTSNSQWTFLDCYIGAYDLEDAWIYDEDKVSMVISSAGTPTSWTDASVLVEATITYDARDYGVVYLTDGDAYFRTRSMFRGSAVENIFVESYNISDFCDSNYYSKGRPTAIINQKEERREATAMYSELYVPNTDINDLNRVYPDVNFEDYNKKFGAIVLMQDVGDGFLMIQEDKVSKVLMDRSLSYDANGDENYLRSENVVLSQQIPYQGEYGIHSPFSFVNYGGRSYWADINRGVVIRLSSNGIEEISRYGMKGWINDAFKDAIKNDEVSICGAYDVKKGQYILSLSDSEYVLAFNEGKNAWTHFISMYVPIFSEYINNRTFIVDKEPEGAAQLFEINSQDVDRGEKKESETQLLIAIPYISFISNAEPSELKNYQSIALDSNYPMNVAIITYSINGKTNQSSSLLYTDFRERESEFDAAFLRDANTPNVTNPLIEGDTMKGKEAKITLSLPSTYVNEDFYLKLAKIAISKG